LRYTVGYQQMSASRETIPRWELSFHPHSFGDPAGRLFWWDGQLYRGITFEQAPFFARLFDDGVIQGLVEKGLLVDSNLTPLAVEGYGAVVSHKSVPYVSYPQEWCAAMLKDAALTIIDLVKELATKGLTLKDAHPWNLLFDGCKPVFVDLSSIAPLTDGPYWQAYDEFCNYCLYPLILMAHGHERIARSLLPEYGGVQRREVLMLARDVTRPRPTLPRLLRGGFKRVKSLWNEETRAANSRLDQLNRMREEIECIKLPLGRPDATGAASLLPSRRQDSVAEEQGVLRKLIFELEPSSVLEITVDKQRYFREALSLGSRVVSFDTDQAAVARLYQEGHAKGWSVLPLVMDFMKPTPSIGYSNHYLMAATERFKCEMVLAIGLVRKGVLEYSLSFDLLVEGLALFSTRWVVVDFPMLEEKSSSKPRTGTLSWYTRENFMEVLKKRFQSIRIIDGELDSRAVFLCEK
jgi:hypothetical protein